MPSKELGLRTFAPDDDDELIGFPDPAALRRFAGETLTWPLTSSQLDTIRADRRVRAWTGWTTERPRSRVAHAELVGLDERRALLARVAVAPAHRRCGVGTTLVDAVLGKARALQIRHVELNVYRDNVSALRLYRAAGFEERGALADREDVVRMARDLG